MATKEELFAAVRLLKKHCRESVCSKCVLKTLCHDDDRDCIGDSSPHFWPAPEEGGYEDG